MQDYNREKTYSQNRQTKKTTSQTYTNDADRQTDRKM